MAKIIKFLHVKGKRGRVAQKMSANAVTFALHLSEMALSCNSGGSLCPLYLRGQRKQTFWQTGVLVCQFNDQSMASLNICINIY